MEQYKRTQVIILPTNKTGNIGADNWYLPKTNTLIINNYVSHLYIISDDKIKDGDWCYNFRDNIIEKYNSKDIYNLGKGYSKIIATTDTSLFKATGKAYETVNGFKPTYKNLPQPSQQFIEKYIESYDKGEVITDVLVEYEDIFTQNNEEYIHTSGTKGYYSTHDSKLKVNQKDNTITIKKLKDSWNREEVKRLLVDCCGEIYCEDGTLKGKSPGDLYEWIDQNL